MTGTDTDEWRYDEDGNPTEGADTGAGPASASADADADADPESMPARSAGAAMIGGVLLGLVFAMLFMGHLNWAFGYMALLAMFSVGWHAAAASGR